MQDVTPGGGRRKVRWSVVPVASDWGGDGDLVADTTDSIATTLRNIGPYPFEYRVGSGPWVRLEERTAILLDVNLATTTIRLRRARVGGSGIARLEIESLSGISIDSGDVVQINAAGVKLKGAMLINSASSGGPASMALNVGGINYSPTKAIKVQIDGATYYWPLFGPVA